MKKKNLDPRNDQKNPLEGILLVNKAKGHTSFHLVHLLRKITHVRKIGHAGTLDPFASGVMILLIGKKYTKKSDSFINKDKEYEATLRLGITTDTFDPEGKELSKNDHIPSDKQLKEILSSFQGEQRQTPPMYSAKKVMGQKLYHLARKGKTIERKPISITLDIQLISYEYPFVKLHITCSKGTYIRTLAHDIGENLGCGAYLYALERTRCGDFYINQCVDQNALKEKDFQIATWLQK